MVLDSAVDPDPRRIWYRNNLDQAPGFERRWYDFRAWGPGTTPRTGSAPPRRPCRQLRRVREAVARTPAGGTVGTGELHSAFVRAAYYDDVWPERAAALAAFLRGDPGRWCNRPPRTRPRRPRPRTRRPSTRRCCATTPPGPRLGDLGPRQHRTARTAPFETWANAFLNLPCAYWPVRRGSGRAGVGSARRLPGRSSSRRSGTGRPRTRVLGAPAAARRRGGAGDGGAGPAPTECSAPQSNDCVDRHVERYL